MKFRGRGSDTQQPWGDNCGVLFSIHSHPCVEKGGLLEALVPAQEAEGLDPPFPSPGGQGAAAGFQLGQLDTRRLGHGVWNSVSG